MRRMRVACLAVASACSFPRGREQTWPPDGQIASLIAEDLDEDGSTDVIVFENANKFAEGSVGGLYVLRGGQDLFLDRSYPIESFEAFVPLNGETLTAIEVDSDHVAIVSRSEDGLDATMLRLPDFVEAKPLRLLGEQASSAWTRILTIGSDDYLLVGASGRIVAVAVTALLASNAQPVELLPPPGESWAGSTLAITGANDTIVVATPTTFYRATLSDISSQPAWSVIRNDVALEGLAAVDLNSDGLEDLVGFATETPALCAFDVNAATLQTECIAADVGNYDGTQIVTGEFAASTRPDLLVVRLGLALSEFDRYGDCTLGVAGLSCTSREPALQAGQGPFFLKLARSGERHALVAIDQVSFPYCLLLDRASIDACD